MRPEIAVLHDYLDFGCFALDLGSRILIDPSGRAVELRRREFDLLLTLARSPGRVMSRATLLDAIAGREAEAFDRTIDVYIGRLRRKIETDTKQPRLIVTVPGVGYRLAAKPMPAQPSSRAYPNQRPDEPAARAALGIVTAFNKASFDKNAEAVAALYAEDATMIKSIKLLSGRAAIEADLLQFYDRYSPHPSKLEHVAVIGNDMMLRAGSWSGTYQAQGGPVHLWGSWTTTDVREGATWKIHTETSFVRSGSYMSPAKPPAQPPSQVSDAGCVISALRSE
jgi:uncharacterized protein (TIGR02246 family)